MKLMTLSCLLVATTAVAQTSSQPAPATSLQPLTAIQQERIAQSAREFASRIRLGKIACPVIFTDVSLKSRAHYMPVQMGKQPDDGLAFQYRNQSGKEIQSISVRVDLKVKRSVYDLDATAITLNMNLTGKEAEEILPLKMPVYSLERVTLQQIAYLDGTVWTAEPRNTCSYEKVNTVEQIGKLQ